MEGVGARLGRSSTRYGPATVFTGPVRKWRKKWVHVTPSNAASNHHSHSHSHNHHHHHHPNNTANSNGTVSGGNISHLLLYKWTPTSQSHSGSNANKNAVDKSDVPEEPPRRKFKYIPIAVLEEQKEEAMENELEEKAEDEEEEEKVGAGEVSLKDTNSDEKPDINDVPMEEESQEKKVRQDLNESTLDLSLNLNARDDNDESGSKADHN